MSRAAAGVGSGHPTRRSVTFGPRLPSLKAISVNANGLSRPRKLVALLAHLRHCGAGIALIQEAHVDPAMAANLIPGMQALWTGLQVFLSPGSPRARGCIIAISPSSTLSDAHQVDCPGNDGRFVRVDAVLHGRPITFASIHAPNSGAERRAFFQLLPGWLPTDGRLLAIGGDFNCVASADLDCVYGLQGPPRVNTRLQGYAALRTVMQQHDLHDVWRQQNPSVQDVTHVSGSAGSAARLDRWLVSGSLLQAAAASADIEAHAGIPTDHLPVSLCLAVPPPVPLGTGLRSFPTRLFHHQTASDELAAYVASRCSSFLAAAHSDPVLAWDAEKEGIRLAAWDIYRACRQRDEQADNAARTAAANARAALALLGLSPATVQAWQATVGAAVASWANRHQRSADVAAALDQLRGDTSSYYFHAQAKAPAPPVILRSLHRPGRPAGDSLDPADLSSFDGVAKALGYAATHFSSASACGLFRDRTPDAVPRDAAQARLLQALTRTLDPWQAQEAEGPDGDGRLTAVELRWAMRHARRGSSPGHDGLPYEFYVAHADTVLPVLLRVFNTVFTSASTSSPLARLLNGVVCLIPKPGKSLDDLENMRPITLLNADVKLVMLVMSNRLQRPLEFLIDITQSSFLVGRDISDNVRYHLSLSARLQELGLPGWLLLSDLAKAYDSVNRGYLRRVMTAMGFRRDGVVRWVGMLLGGTSSRVRLNGFLSAAFPVHHSLAQGASVSCQQWAIVMQPLVSYLESLRAQGHITSVGLPGGVPAPASMQYADDVKHPTVDPDSDLPPVQEAYSLFEVASGVAQSTTKCVLVHIVGPTPAAMDPATTGRHVPTGYSLQPIHAPPARLLGVPFSDDPAACIAAAFAQKARGMRTVAAHWGPLQVGLLGRVHVAQACMASKAVYVSTFLAPQPSHLKDMQEAINAFIAASDRPEEEVPFKTKLYPRFSVASLPLDAGGLAVPHLQHSFAAMRCKSVYQSFRHHQHPWAALFLHEVARARPAALPPTFPSGPVWAVLAGCAPHLPAVTDHDLDGFSTPYVKEAVAAFRKLQVERVAPAIGISGLSVLLELTHHNDAFQAPPIVSALALTWTRLQDLRAASAAAAGLSPDELSDMHSIIAALPPPWQAVVTAVQPPDSPWCIISLPGEDPVVLEGPAEDVPGGRQLWRLLSTGRLASLHLPFAATAGCPARPALVVQREKPEWAYTRADHAKMAAVRADGRDAPPLTEPHLAGIWDDMHLDPTVWGVGGCSLLHLCARDIRLHLAKAAGADVLGISEAGAVWPKVWARQGFVPPDPNEIQLSPTGRPAGEADGLFAVQDKWLRAALSPDPLEDDHPQDVDRVPAFLDLTRQRPPRRPVWERVEGRLQHPHPGPAPAALDPRFPDVWKRLCDPTLHRPHRITCWRILHACLGCNAFLSYARGGRHASSTSPYCSALACAGRNAVETLTHAFIDCPEVAPVTRWLCDTWRELAGVEPPCSPDVLLCDDPRAWPGPHDAKALQLWTRLRVATVGSIWRLRCARARPDGDPRSMAHRAVKDVIRTVTDAIRRDWARARSDVRYDDQGDLDRDWWSAVDVGLSPQRFKAMWATPPILCDVTAGLHVRFGVHGPVPVPPA